MSYDLADDADQQAFDQLREDPSNLTGNFEQRLSRIADRTATDTVREMTISDVSASVETRDGVGVIRVSAEWSNLASVSGDELTLTEPFASEFQPDRLFVVDPPEGYQLATSSHKPANTDAETVQWTSGSGIDVSGFQHHVCDRQLRVASHTAYDGACAWTRERAWILRSPPTSTKTVVQPVNRAYF